MVSNQWSFRTNLSYELMSKLTRLFLLRIMVEVTWLQSTKVTTKYKTYHKILQSCNSLAVLWLLQACHHAFWPHQGRAGENGHGLRRDGALKPVAKLRISLPGQPIVEAVSLRHGTTPVLICSVETSLFKSKHKDIVLLKCKYISPNYLEISCNQLKSDSIVDIIDYPDDITTHWLSKHPQICSIMESKVIADKLLSLNYLTITRGNIVGTNSSMTYTVSTCRGMSGRCVLTERQSLWYMWCPRFHLNITRVHIGQVDMAQESLPMATLSRDDDVQRLLKRHNLMSWLRKE